MAITVVPSVITGQTYSAANFNTHIRDNINGIWVLTTAGDMLYATGASAANRLALVPNGVMVGGASAPEWLAPGGVGTLLGINSSNEPEWAPLVYRRQGGDASNWQSSGSTNYTPTERVYMQVGSLQISINPTGSGSVTYGVPFAARPLLTFGITTSGGAITHRFDGDDENGFTMHLRDVITAGALNVTVNWTALGKI